MISTNTANRSTVDLGKRTASLRALLFLLLANLMGWVPLKTLAAIPKTTLPVPNNTFITEGSFHGGGVGNGFSLLSVKRVFSSDGRSERLIFQIGDREGKAYNGEVGYFNAELKKHPAQLNLDLSQLTTSRVSLTNLRELIATSRVIRDVQMGTDSEDNSTNITMSLQGAVKMRVFSLASKLGSPKIVVDMIRTQ